MKHSVLQLVWNLDWNSLINVWSMEHVCVFARGPDVPTKARVAIGDSLQHYMVCKFVSERDYALPTLTPLLALCSIATVFGWSRSHVTVLCIWAYGGDTNVRSRDFSLELVQSLRAYSTIPAFVSWCRNRPDPRNFACRILFRDLTDECAWVFEQFSRSF